MFVLSELDLIELTLNHILILVLTLSLTLPQMFTLSKLDLINLVRYHPDVRSDLVKVNDERTADTEEKLSNPRPVPVLTRNEHFQAFNPTAQKDDPFKELNLTDQMVSVQPNGVGAAIEEGNENGFEMDKGAVSAPGDGFNLTVDPIDLTVDPKATEKAASEGGGGAAGSAVDGAAGEGSGVGLGVKGGDDASSGGTAGGSVGGFGSVGGGSVGVGVGGVGGGGGGGFGSVDEKTAGMVKSILQCVLDLTQKVDDITERLDGMERSNSKTSKVGQSRSTMVKQPSNRTTNMIGKFAR